MRPSSHFTIKTAAAWILTALVLAAQPSAFTYQGRLSDGGSPANGAYDIQFDLKDAATAGNTVGTVTVNPVTVADGVFTVELDYGFAPAFIGFNRWLEISARPAGSVDPYTTLTPAQPINSTPYANFAASVNAAGLIGQVSDANLSTTLSFARTFSNPGNIFHGDGANLTDLDAGAISSGTLADSVLSANVPLENTANTFSADQIFTGSVGIGNSAPDTKLTLTTNSGVNNSVDFALKLHNDDFGNTTTGMLFSVEGVAGPGANYAKAGIAFQRTNSFARGKLHFLQNNATNTNSATLADAVMTLDNGNVGIGNTSPASKLTVNGTIESTTGGVKFPNGTTQTTAALGSTTEYKKIGPADFVPQDSNDRVIRERVQVYAYAGNLLAPVDLPGGARITKVTCNVFDNTATDLTFLFSEGSITLFSIDTQAVSGSGTAVWTGSQTLNNTAPYSFLVIPTNGGWPGNGTLSIQSIVIEWDRP